MTGASEWSGSLGQSWSDHLDGLEATLAPLNEIISAALELNGEEYIADIGCGGGGLTRHLSQVSTNGIRVTGFDISPVLIDAAKLRAGSIPLEFICANAETHILKGKQFDRLTSRFGIMFFQNERLAFENLKSWLKPSGRFAFAVWADYTENPWMGAIRDIASKNIDLPKAGTHQPGPVRYADIKYFTTLLEQIGFADISTKTWEGTLKLGGGRAAPDAAKFGLSAFWGQELPASNPNHAQALETLTAVLKKHEVAGEVSMPACSYIITGKI